MMKQYAKTMKAPNLTDNMQNLVDDAAEGGLKYLICASTAINTMDKIKAAVVTFSKAGEACKKAGLQFAYHNHATEWDAVGGTTAYDYILSQTDKNLVKMELDLGWVATAKKNPVELFKGHPGRFPLFHVKDFKLATSMIVPIGQGDIDFKPAFENAKLAGMKYFFYEQDTAKSMDEVSLSYNNLRKVLQLV
jgi:sugar phosphate isomerase/epimerase